MENKNRKIFLGCIVGVVLVGGILLLNTKTGKENSPTSLENGSDKSSTEKETSVTIKEDEKKNEALSVNKIESTPVVGKTSNTKEEKPGCMTMKYEINRSKQTANVKSWTGNNKFELPTSKVNPASICVRIKNRAVAHEYLASENSVYVGPVSKSIEGVEISYCSKGAHCSISCKIDKDEFMAALSGDDQTSFHANSEQQNEQDEAELAREDAGLQADLKAFDMDMNKKSNGNIFTGWNQKESTEYCKSKMTAQR